VHVSRSTHDTAPSLVVRFLDIFQVTQALTTVLSNHKQLADMRRSWNNVDFESVRNQAALVCNCRHEDLVQLLEVDFVKMMDTLPTTNEPVRTVMAWADDCCDRLMGQRNGGVTGTEDRGTLSSRSVLIRWGYVTSQIMRDLVKLFVDLFISLKTYS
jgi:regulatory factor X 1/2/3